MNTIYEVPYKGESFWGYELKNTATGKWYLGYSKKKLGVDGPEDYVTNSNDSELRNAISNGEIDRHVIQVDNSESAILIWETQQLTERDAKNDPNCYNHNNGMAPENKLPNVKMLNAMAKGILENHEISGVRARILDLSEHKEWKNNIGKLKATSPYNDWDSEQVRDLLIDSNHVDEIATDIDDAYGNLDMVEKSTGQKLLVVILKDYKHPDGRVADTKIGGNHTWKGVIKSQWGTKIPLLEIPPSIHGDWCEDSVTIFGELMNPRDKKKILHTKASDTLRTALRLARKHGKDNKVITELLNEEGYNSKQKISIKGKIATRLENEIEDAEQKSLNFNDWKDDESKEIIEKKRKEYAKDPTTIVGTMSTGKAGIGNYVSRYLNTIQNGTTKIKKVHVILSHPKIRYKKKFDDEYKKYFECWKVTLKLAHDVDLSWEEMPSYQKSKTRI